jgi:hypothetical protein
MKWRERESCGSSILEWPEMVAGLAEYDQKRTAWQSEAS